VVFFVGGVTVEESEVVRQMACAMDGGVDVVVAATGLCDHSCVVRDICMGLPVISSHVA
jgi:hypothetical protein